MPSTISFVLSCKLIYNVLIKLAQKQRGIICKRECKKLRSIITINKQGVIEYGLFENGIDDGRSQLCTSIKDLSCCLISTNKSATPRLFTNCLRMFPGILEYCVPVSMPGASACACDYHLHRLSMSMIWWTTTTIHSATCAVFLLPDTPPPSTIPMTLSPPATRPNLSPYVPLIRS